MLVKDYHSTLRNNPETRKSQVFTLLALAMCDKNVNWIHMEMCPRKYMDLQEVGWRMEDTVYIA
jgi:hypothetical protein